MFGKDKEKIRGKDWDWSSFKSTKDYPVSENLLDWVIGQDKALEECYLCLDEWVHKLRWIQKDDWYKAWKDPNTEKPSAKKFIPAGPYLLLLGDAGTGKSLIGRALASHLTELYKKEKIKLRDVICWRNKLIPSEPKISIHGAGNGRKIVRKEKLKHEKRNRLMKLGINVVKYFLATIGGILISIGFYKMWDAYLTWLDNPLTSLGPLHEIYEGNLLEYMMDAFLGIASSVWLPAGMMLIFLVLIFILGRFGMMGGTKGIAGTEQTSAPKLIVDNSEKTAPFIDATGHGSAQLFGSIAWDPLQCYDEKTRLFTADNKLKYWWEIKETDKVYSLNSKTRELEILPIKDVVVLNYKGEMLRLKGQRMDLLVTPNHKMFTSWTPSSPLQVQTADYLNRISYRRYLPTRPFKWFSDKYPLPSWLINLLGWYIAEGHPRKDRKYIIITQKKYPDIIEYWIQKSGMKYYTQSHGNGGRRFVIEDEQFYNWCLKCGKGSRNKKIPREILELPTTNLEEMFKALIMGNGGNARVFHTTSYKLALDFIELCLKTQRKPTLGETREGFYWISTSKTNTSLKPEHWYQKWEYNGKVWCVHLEKNHNFLVERNGKFVFCGNTGGLGTPEHQRTSAGDVHRANLGILYIDEIKNLHPEEAVTLLTVLEEGQLPITLRSKWHAGGTSAMAVSTEPVPCLTFLVGAGNFDSIGLIHPALMDRIYGYGKVVRMNNDMPNTQANRRKYIQFIAQESKRFHLIPFSKEACEEIVAEGRRRSGKRDRLATKFRPLISIIKTSATLAMNEKRQIVERRHVKEAIDEHCKTIQKQLLEHEIEERGRFLEIKPKGRKLGSIYGLAVARDEYSGEMTGTVLPVKGFVEKRKKLERKARENMKGYFEVTGIAKAAQWIDDSVAKVRTAIIQKYGVDIAQQYFTHIDFAQSHGVDGPSAGVTMTLLLCSLLEGKSIDQSVAVTGEINIGVGDEIKITAIGGCHEKIKAAEAWGFKRVIIPMKNLKYSVDPKDYKLEVVGAKTLEDYLKHCLVKE